MRGSDQPPVASLGLCAWGMKPQAPACILSAPPAVPRAATNQEVEMKTLGCESPLGLLLVTSSYKSATDSCVHLRDGIEK